MFWFGKKKEVKTRPYRIGLALGGGGARGFAHIGVLRALEEMGIKPDVISGTSAGSIIAALYADGYAPQHIIRLFSELDVKELVDVTIPRNSLLKMDKFIHFIDKRLHSKRIEDLKIPTYIVATDFDNGKSVAFDKGDLAIRIAASCSIPIVFPPIAIDGIHYVDGGVMRNLPVTPIRDLCDVVIGINVSPMQHEQYENNLLSITNRAYNFLSCGNVFPDIALCDILIENEDISGYNVFDIDEQEKIEELGYQKAIEVLNNLTEQQLSLLNNTRNGR
ncbi:MAG: patatin-like phospholipase family protein [Bacteroidaceae bacterium]|nr:patatin-like phospholipase family protein [Bacteroidaceae bacterium]